jgi:light-regulated signal transduction histidine kinase (bacteriophytochrome)
MGYAHTTHHLRAPSGDTTQALLSPNLETPELEKLREEIDLVGYLASHDLVVPLRTILIQSEILEAQAGTSLNEKARSALQEVTANAERMRMLMQGLLDYIRLDTYRPSFAMVEGNEIVAASIAALSGEIASAGAQVACDPLPRLWGHKGRLVRLFTMLIDNALKFRGPYPPEVNISCHEEAGNWVFCVQDNGIGIEEEYYDIVFRLFQRLHPDEAYPGEGIGLALCRRTVESHGGMMSLESTVGEGSRFLFTFPVKHEGDQA